MSALRGILFSSIRQNVAVTVTARTARRPLVATSWFPTLQEQHQVAHSIERQVGALSTLRRALTGPLSARMRLPMRGLEEFCEPEPLSPDQKLVTGRSWTVKELRKKSFDDLHKLWFVLYKEKNMIYSEMMLANRRRSKFPQIDRREKVKRSMKAIRVVVGERQRIKRALLEERQAAAKQAVIEERRAEKEAEKAERMERHSQLVARRVAEKAARIAAGTEGGDGEGDDTTVEGSGSDTGQEGDGEGARGDGPTEGGKAATASNSQ